MATEVYQKENGKLVLRGILPGAGESTGTAGCGGAAKMVLSEDTALDADSPRNLLLEADAAGLTIKLPPTDTLQADGMAFIFGCTGSNAITVTDAGGFPIGADGGVLKAGAMRIYLLVDEEKKRWMADEWGGGVNAAGDGVGTNVSAGIETAVGSFAIKSIALCKVSDDKILMVYARDTTANSNLYARVGTVNFGTNKVTFGAQKAFSNAYNASGARPIVRLSDTKFATVVRASSTGTNYAHVITISGRTVSSIGAAQMLALGEVDDVLPVSETEFLILGTAYGGKNVLLARMNVSGNTVSLGDQGQYTANANIGALRAVSLTEDKILVSGAYFISPKSYLFFILFTLSNDSITAGAVKTLVIENSSYYPALAKLSATEALCFVQSPAGQLYTYRVTAGDAAPTVTLLDTSDTSILAVYSMAMQPLSDGVRYLITYNDVTTNKERVISRVASVYGATVKYGDETVVSAGRAISLRDDSASHFPVLLSDSKVVAAYNRGGTNYPILNVFDIS